MQVFSRYSALPSARAGAAKETAAVAARINPNFIVIPFKKKQRNEVSVWALLATAGIAPNPP
jgi:hypothetical protein